MKSINDNQSSWPSKEAIATPYQKAKQEWDDRIGSSEVKAKNWMVSAILSLIVSCLVLLCFLINLFIHQDKIFVAEFSKEGRVINVLNLNKTYHPTIAQEEYFIGNFIKLIGNLSFDPVVTKRDWLTAYKFLTSSGAKKLSSYFKASNVVSCLGKKTRVVEILNIRKPGSNTFDASWTEESFDLNGQNIEKKNRHGTFTIVIKQPNRQDAILVNPLGIYIVDFNIENA